MNFPAGTVIHCSPTIISASFPSRGLSIVTHTDDTVPDSLCKHLQCNCYVLNMWINEGPSHWSRIDEKSDPLLA